MSLPSCIPGLIADGKIRAKDGQRAQEAYDRNFRRLAHNMSEAAASAEASRLALNELDYENGLKARQSWLKIKAQTRLDKELDAVLEAGSSPYGHLVNLLNDIDVAKQRLAFQGQADIREFIERHRRNFTGGNRDATGMRDVVTELHGGDTGNPRAKLFAQAITDTFDRYVARFNAAGGDLATRADFGLPHRHDPLLVRKAGYETWKAAIAPELDFDKMVDPISGGPFTPDRVEEFLFNIWKTISTGGLTAEGNGIASRILANRRNDQRVLRFKDGEAWLRYNDKFGGGNPFDAVIGHLDGLSRDIAFMERLGPDPAVTWKQGMTRADAGDAASSKAHSGAVAGTSAGSYRADKLWRFMNGEMSVPVFADSPVVGWIHRKATGAVHGTRDLISAAFLGSSQLTAISDANTQMFARYANGLPLFRAITGYLEQLNPLSHAGRREAIELGLGVRDGSRAMLGIARYVGELQSPKWTQVIADDVLRVSGVNKFTEAGQRSFGRDYLRQLAAERQLAWGDLSKIRRAAFEQNGITPENWDVMRSAPVLKGESGSEAMNWRNVAGVDQGVSDKMMDMVLRETRSAVVESNAEIASLLRWGRPGTLRGEFGSNILQFKSFTAAMMLGQARRVSQIARQFGWGRAGMYAASFVISMTMFGAISLQLREFAKSRSMRPMDNKEFWFDAFTQGGGLGIFGDLIGSFVNDRINNVSAFLGGPMVGLAQDLRDTGAAFVPNEQGESHGGRAVVRLARRYTPGSNLWFSRAATDRLIFDQLQREMDPNYFESWDRMEEIAQRQGQHFLWRPGQMAPDNFNIRSGPAAGPAQ